MRRRHLWASVIIPALLIGAVAARTFAPKGKDELPAPSDTCMAHLTRLAAASLTYASDYDELLPLGASWMDSSESYLRPAYPGDATPVLSNEHCTSTHSASDYGYAFNADSRSAAPDRPGKVSMIYDSTRMARNAFDHYSSLPIPGRHPFFGGKMDFVAYVDGHVGAVARPATHARVWK